MKSLRLSAILILIISGITLAGCSLLPSKKLHVPVGSVVEVAGTARVKVVYTNKETGKREKRVVTLRPDGVWYVGRLAPKEKSNGKRD